MCKSDSWTTDRKSRFSRRVRRVWRWKNAATAGIAASSTTSRPPTFVKSTHHSPCDHV